MIGPFAVVMNVVIQLIRLDVKNILLGQASNGVIHGTHVPHHVLS